MPGFEPGISQPQCEVLTTILHTPGEAGYRSQYLSHAKRALYHLSYIPIQTPFTATYSQNPHTSYHNTRTILDPITAIDTQISPHSAHISNYMNTRNILVASIHRQVRNGAAQWMFSERSTSTVECNYFFIV